MFKVGDKVIFKPRTSFPYEIPCTIHQVIGAEYTLKYSNGYYESAVRDH
jgi:hypothetical protein